MTLTDIFSDLYVENKEFECKGRLNRENTVSWLKTIGGFANSQGGCIFLGVEDKTLKLIGFDRKDLDKEKLFFHNEVKNHMAVLPSYYMDVIPYEINNSIRYIIKITVQKADKKPLIVKYDGFPFIFVRRDGFTNSATEEEIRAMVLTSKRPSFDEGLTDIDFDLKDFSKYASFYKARTGKELTVKQLESIDFFIDGKLTNGAYLFNDNYAGNRTAVVCSIFSGCNRGSDTMITSSSFNGNLIDSYYFINEFIERRMRHKMIKLDDRRIDVDSYPRRALFEAIINSLAHRDYLIDGTQINIDIFEDRLVVASPGSLFEGTENLAPTYNLDSFSSKRRNKLISDIFVLAKAMEAKGTGFEKIMEEYSSYDQKHRPYIFSKNNTFFIVLPDLTNDNGVTVDSDSVFIIGKMESPSRFDTSVLSYCYLNERTIKDITDHLNISNSTFFRKNVINNLVEQGYLIEKKSGNKKSYLTNIEKVSVQ
ncbi:MAG: putative DNA binding domain-containing protein [Clostridia bacterium]|nr:putative DNA binding domain-containing protein [Clostridia bacterium]